MELWTKIPCFLFQYPLPASPSGIDLLPQLHRLRQPSPSTPPTPAASSLNTTDAGGLLSQHHRAGGLLPQHHRAGGLLPQHHRRRRPPPSTTPATSSLTPSATTTPATSSLDDAGDLLSLDAATYTLSCEGKCFRSFHATVDIEVAEESNLQISWFTT